MDDSAGTLIQCWLEAGDRGEFERFEEFLHEDVVVHAPLGLSSHGIAVEQEVWRRAVSVMPGIRHDLQEVFVNGDAISARVVVTGRLDGEFAGIVSPGRSFQVDQAVFVHLRDGKAAEVWQIVDSGALREQLTAP